MYRPLTLAACPVKRFAHTYCRIKVVKLLIYYCKKAKKFAHICCNVK